jgi:hypothetical protein
MSPIIFRTSKKVTEIIEKLRTIFIQTTESVRPKENSQGDTGSNNIGFSMNTKQTVKLLRKRHWEILLAAIMAVSSS